MELEDQESPLPAPSAPPYPPPMLQPWPDLVESPLQVPSHEENSTVTEAAGILTNKPKSSNASLNPVPWSTGLCDCCDDCNSCCLTCWCPCVTFGRIAEIVDRGSTSCGVSGALYMLILCVTGCSCMYSCFYRSKLRGQYLLKESPCTDCCIHCCCEECALCQEYRQLKNLGFDMSIGWHGNMERKKRLSIAATPPSIESGMSR